LVSESKLREKLLSLAKYEAVELPDRGPVELLAYVSSGAFSAFFQQRDDPRRAFYAMIGASLREGSECGVLSDRDVDVLASLYASSMKCDKEYYTAKQVKNQFEAFLAAIESTDSWTSRLEDERRLTAYLNWTVKPYFDETRKQMQMLESTLANFHQQLVPQQFLCVPQMAPAFRSGLLQIRSDLLLPRVDTITNLTRIAQRQMDAWRQHAGFHEDIRKGFERLSQSTQWLNQITEQVSGIHRILDSVPDITRMLRTAAEIMSSGSVTAQMLECADAALGQSSSVINQANRYFSRNDGTLSPITSSTLLSKLTVEEQRTIEAATDTTFTAEGMLHDETAGLVVVSGEAARLIADVVEQKIEEKLKPFGNILRRLECASRPNTFRDLLLTFAKVAAREYWQAIWSKPGESFLPNPERVAQAFLGLFLHGHWEGVGFVGREIANGDGYVDLLVHLLGHDYLVELKILGCSWGIGHAKDGLDQLDAYMRNYQRREAFLVVFDGRKTSKGEQLEPSYDVGHGRVHVVTVRVYFDAPTGVDTRQI
jgi:hypothetical protein